ncbi:unnamed protein product [Trichobilharzia regenti]|nr:unnamed protein product [Trichobilharzia regenti]
MKTTRPILISESNKPTSCIPNHQEVGKVKRITFSDTVYNNTCTSISQNKQNKKSIQSHNENDVIISTNNSNELLKGELVGFIAFLKYTFFPAIVSISSTQNRFIR